MGHVSLALFDRFPRAAAAIPRLALLERVTPVHRLDRLSRGPGRELWVKRDDRTAERYGGNKPRKLELLLAGARRACARTILTTGGLGSNHALATCLYGRRAGFDVHVLLFPQPVTDHVRMSLRLFSRHATRMHPGTSYDELPALVERITHDLPGSVFFPSGGSTPLGAIGLVSAALEIADQVGRGEMPEPGTIVLAAGTCGTIAGLALGLKIAGLRTRAVGVRVVDQAMASPAAVLVLADGAARILSDADPSIPRVRLAETDFDLLHDYFGPGYGHSTTEGEAAIARARDAGGLALEPTYTGKAFAAALDLLATRAAAAPVLFWNTFAGPVLAAEAGSIPAGDVPEPFRGWLA
jgi:D-cysteine desulfhydrase